MRSIIFDNICKFREFLRMHILVHLQVVLVLQRIHINIEVVAQDERLDGKDPIPAEASPLGHHSNVLQPGELPSQVEKCQLR